LTQKNIFLANQEQHLWGASSETGLCKAGFLLRKEAIIIREKSASIESPIKEKFK